MPSSQSQVFAIGVVFMLLPVIFVGLRVWARRLSKAGLGWDDYTLFMALAMAIACCTVQLLAAVHGQLGQHQANTADGMPILDDPRFLLYERCKFALNMLTYLGYGFSKASFLLLYHRVWNVKPFFIWPRILLCIVIAWTVAFFFASLFQCYPVTALIEPFYGNTCVNGIGLWYTGGATDIAIDLIILLMPIPMVLRLQLNRRQKIAVICVFLTGALAAASSITRFVVYFQVGNALHHHFNDETYFTTPVFVWSVIELSLAVISACLPTLKPIFDAVLSTNETNASNTPSSHLSTSHGGKDGAATLASIESLSYRHPSAFHTHHSGVKTNIHRSSTESIDMLDKGAIKVRQSMELSHSFEYT